MIELKRKTLEFSFPEVHPHAKCRIEFQRTMRIPDNDQTHYLPPSFGNFPLHHIDDFASIPKAWQDRGGIFLPMYQSEAMWISFDSDYPCAIKIAAGKINAVTGDAWCDELRTNKQDYVVTPDQPWLDGFNVGKDTVRQFVAMPLGEGYTAEEQITGAAEFGGLQILVSPMKKEVYEKKYEQRFGELFNLALESPAFSINDSMGIAPGGKIKQEIYTDDEGIDAWDQDQASRCFVHIVNSNDYASITGSIPPFRPILAADYEAAGLPWYDYYSDSAAEEGSDVLASLKSLGDAQGILEDHLGEGEDMATPSVLVSINKGNKIMSKYDGKSGNEILQMAIDAKSFEEMRCHLVALANKKSLNKKRLAELVDTAVRITGNDPESPPETVKPKPTYWPSKLTFPTNKDGTPNSDLLMLREESPLHMVGYKVGYTAGLKEHARRYILSNFFERELHPELHRIFDDELGTPGSIKRLLRAANTIAGVCKLNKLKNDPTLDYAIKCWEEDLSFMKSQFFDSMKNRKSADIWPTT